LKEKFIFMHISDFLHQLNSKPETLGFSDTMATIDANYLFTATEFSNGDMHNAAGQNSGSCKLFAFAKLHQFTEAQTLACFGDYYRKDVLAHPDAQDHQNIRNFMRSGWAGIRFAAQPLSAK
jgi:hypothetical protein